MKRPHNCQLAMALTSSEVSAAVAVGADSPRVWPSWASWMRAAT